MKTPVVQLPVTSLAVRYETAICDRHGRVERVLQSGTNMITDWGMDSMATTNIGTNVDYLHLGDVTETLKRVLPGGNSITINAANPAAVTVVAASTFFEAADAGRVLKITGWAELLVTGFTDAQNITCKSRAALWPPGFTPPGTGPYTDVAIHYTNKATLGNEFTRLNTYDTASANNDTDLVEPSNSRFIHQRIFLSAAVAGSAWTVNQLGWGPNTTNCFGKTNLASPDVVAVGKKYRVLLQVFHAYTPIDLTGVVLDWGATVGSYTCAIRQERIATETPANGYRVNFLRPALAGTGPGTGWWTTTFTMSSIGWDGDAGYSNLWGRAGRQTNLPVANLVFDSSYTAGDHRKTRTARWPDTAGITAAFALFVSQPDTGNSTHYPALTIKPASGTITKAGGYRIDISFVIAWQRTLVN